jgi:hypothetical protein
MSAAVRDGSAATGLRDRKTAEGDRSRRPATGERLLLGLVIALLTVVPALVAAARPSSYRSEVELRVPQPEARRLEPPRAYVTSFVGGPILRGHMMELLGDAWPQYRPLSERIAVTAGRREDGGRVIVAVPAERPSQARELAGFVAEKLLADAALKYPARRRARAALARVERALREPGLEPARRRELLARRRSAEATAAVYVPIVPLRASGPATQPKLSGIDSAVRRLLGHDQPPPSPLWSGFAGLLLALALCALWLLVRAAASDGR